MLVFYHGKKFPSLKGRASLACSLNGSHLIGDLLYFLQTNKTFHTPMIIDNRHRQLLQG